MLVHTMFLFREGVSAHRQFTHPPYGLSFGPRAEILATMPKPERTWKIGKGNVPLATRGVSHDRWVFDGLYVSADYDLEEKVRSVDVSVMED